MYCIKHIVLLMVLTLTFGANNCAVCQQGYSMCVDNELVINDTLVHYLDSLSHEIAVMPDSREKLVSLNRFTFYHPNIDTVKKYAQMELRLATSLHENNFLINAYSHLGFAEYYSLNFDKALHYYKEMMLMSDSMHLDYKKAKSCHQLATVYSTRGNHAMADKYYAEALKIFEELRDTMQICETIRSLAEIYIDFEMLKTAEEYISYAMSMDTLVNNVDGIVQNTYHRGRINYVKYRHTDSLLYLRRSINLLVQACRISDDDYSLADMYMELMFWYVDMSRAVPVDQKTLCLDSANYYYLLAKKYSEQYNRVEDANLFDLWNALYKSEHENYNEAYQIFKTIEGNFTQDSMYPDFWINFFYRFSKFYERIEDYKCALAYRVKAEQLRDKIYDREFVVQTTRNKAQVDLDLEIANHNKTVEAKQMKLMYAIIFAVLVLVLLLVISASFVKNKRTNKILLDSNTEIELQRDQLKAINEEITSSIRYAQKIQEASLPLKDDLDNIFGGCLLYWNPMDIVSGDFFWAQQKSHLKFLAVGDCTGHGVPGAFMSMLGISSLNDIVFSINTETWFPSAGALMDVIRMKIVSSLRQSVENEDDTKDGIDLALCIIDMRNHKLHFAGAMRPLFLFRGDKCLQYSGDRMPVGVSFKQDIPFTNHIIDTVKDDTIYLFTDGVVDQFGYVDGVETKFTRKRLCSMLSQIHNLPFNEQQERAEAVFERWANSSSGNMRCPQVDDQLLVGIKI